MHQITQALHRIFADTTLSLIWLSCFSVRPIWLIFIFTLGCLARIAGQSDCATATSVCNFNYDELNSPAGTGNVFEVAPGSCQTGGEFNSAWYVFSPQTDGLLNFELIPNNLNDDYDWSLFNITENGCAGINNGTSPEVSCNSYGETGGQQGTTGISSANGGSGNSNGPGNLNGPAFNADLNVSAGNIYALVVMNYSSTLNGYNLDFGTSPVSIFDNENPTIISHDFNWCTGVLQIQLSEDVDMTGITAASFSTGAAGLQVTAFNDGGDDLTSTFSLTLGPLPLLQNTTISFQTTNNQTLHDICGNALATPIALDLTGGFTFGVETTPACNGLGASLDVFTTGNAAYPPYSVQVNGNAAGNFPLLDIAGGAYSVVLTDALGCSTDTTFTITSEIATIGALQDTTLCSLGGTFSTNVTADEMLWSSNSPLLFSSPQASSTSIGGSEPGLYWVELTATSGNCTSTASFQLELNDPPAIDISITDASCFGVCDGLVEISNLNDAPITVVTTGHQGTGVDVSFDSMCSGSWALSVTHSPSCVVTYPIMIDEPPAVSASFQASQWILPIENTDVVLTSTSIGADSLFWSLEDYPELSSLDSIWELTLPHVVDTVRVQLKAVNAFGCVSYFEGGIIIRDEFRWFIPNSFTPNSDGINDVFLPRFSYQPEFYVFSIFDRWGQLVYRSTEPNQAWTGNFMDGDYYCEDGIYQWTLVVKGTEVDPYELKGHIVLTR
ncbi:MAG: gliding motility-associated C-terminal domain-containing protein [Flavobacteriales bacterium]